MICKNCGMESTSVDRCSFCGQLLAGAREVPLAVSTPLAVGHERVFDESADVPLQQGPDAEQTAPVPSPSTQSTASISPADPAHAAWTAGPRKPAPAILPRASGRALRAAAPPITAAGPHPVAPVQSLGFDTASQDAERPRVSLSDPMAEHTLYMEHAAALSRPAVLLNPDATSRTAASSTTSEGQIGNPIAATAITAPGSKLGEPLPAPALVRKRTPEPDVVGVGAPTALLGRYTIALLLVLLVAAALAFVGPGYQAIPLVAAQFTGGLLLPVMRLVPWADEDSDDVIWFILFTIMFGPLVSLLIYSVLAMIRQSVNAGLMGCMIVAALSRLVVQFAAHDTPIARVIPQTMPYLHNTHFDAHLLALLLKDWSGLVALAGWYFATVFRKLDE